jgi:hypothetical protein
MLKNALQLARQYPTQAEAILTLFRVREDRQALTALLGSCTCTTETLGCTCPPEYTQPKPSDYTGHTPETN